MRRNVIISCAVGLTAAAACTPLFARREDAPPAGGHDHEIVAGMEPRSEGGPPTTRPGGWHGGPGGGQGRPAGNPDNKPPSYGRRGPGDNWRDQTPPAADEWTEIEAFMRENSPTRLAMYDKIEGEFGVERRATQMIRTRIAARYRDLMGLKDRSPDLYDFAFKQLRLEDQVLGTMAQLRREGESPKLLAKLNDQTLSFINNSLDERAARLAKVKEFVAKEEAGLDRDRAHTDELIAKQHERFEKEMSRMLDFADKSDGKADGKGPTSKPADGDK